jgi:hypothetical protein
MNTDNNMKTKETINDMVNQIAINNMIGERRAIWK